ncbi:VanZ family protein [Bacillus sp. FJAT-42376]|uniref:VanZ family protein n=1 Tax=Bacillus sp. FJAT-42376 TaxID=2014076 RepID=UPI000F4E4C26|nr:VanZ family protein [Bacillus sp. FJAT-42376]AZB41777.1 VanZ family protein [Bacillus sp. FJAT-42376]
MEKTKRLILLLPLIFTCRYVLSAVQSASPAVLADWAANTLLLLAAAVPVVKKAHVNKAADWIVLGGFVWFLCVLHEKVTFVSLSSYLTAEHTQSLHVQTNLINLIPFKTICMTFSRPDIPAVMMVQIAGNALMLAPVSFCVQHLKIAKDWRTAMFMTFLVSAGIEGAQLILAFFQSAIPYAEGRATDIDDVILNTFSGLIGCLMFWAVKTVKSKPADSEVHHY